MMTPFCVISLRREVCPGKAASVKKKRRRGKPLEGPPDARERIMKPARQIAVYTGKDSV
jgi:hypothetical protein